MNKFILLLCLLFLPITFGQENPKYLDQINVNSNSSVLVLKYMISHLEEYPMREYPSEELLSDLILINKNLKGIGSEDTKAFLLSELYKVLFDFDRSDLIDARNIYISGANLKGAQDKFDKNQKVLTSFTKFIVLDMLENFDPFLADNYINNYLNTSDPKFNQPEKKKKLDLLNKHVGPWIMLYTRYDSKKFNQLCSKYVRNYFKTIAHLSKFFSYQNLGENSEPIFSVKEGSLEDVMNKLKQHQAAQTDTAEAPEDPKEAVENLTVEPADGAADKIDQIIKKIDQKEQ